MAAISTGLRTLDEALVGGGVLPGSIVHVYGEADSSKSALCLSLCSSAQKHGYQSWWVATEPPPSPAALSWAGISKDDFFVVLQRIDLPGMEVVSALSGFSEKLIVLDSLAALIGGFDEQAIGGLMLQNLPSLKEKLEDTGSILVMTDQLRLCLPAREKLPIGLCPAMLNYADYRISLTATDRVLKAGEAIGYRIRFKVVKNKLEFGRWGVSGKFTCYFSGGLKDLKR